MYAHTMRYSQLVDLTLARLFQKRWIGTFLEVATYYLKCLLDNLGFRMLTSVVSHRFAL